MRVLNAGSPKHEAALMEFGLFIGADEIAYVDCPHGQDGEDYSITKGDKTWTISVRGNKIDGPFANFFDK